MPPADIHNIGLKEFDRIIGEMTALAKANGYDTLEAFRTHIESDPRYTPTSKQQIIDDFDHYIKQMRPKLPLLFTVIPAAPVTVEGHPRLPGRRIHPTTRAARPTANAPAASP